MSAKTAIVCVASALAGIAFILSCSDDAPGSADAANCDCPAAEPPLDGRITETLSAAQDLPANAFTPVTLACPEGSVLLSGGCNLSGFIGVPDAALVSSTKDAAGSRVWACAWANHSVDVYQGTVTVTCLLPAP